MDREAAFEAEFGIVTGAAAGARATDHRHTVHVRGCVQCELLRTQADKRAVMTCDLCGESVSNMGEALFEHSLGHPEELEGPWGYQQWLARCRGHLP
jgi:hypothetical protein